MTRIRLCRNTLPGGLPRNTTGDLINDPEREIHCSTDGRKRSIPKWNAERMRIYASARRLQRQHQSNMPPHKDTIWLETSQVRMEYRI